MLQAPTIHKQEAMSDTNKKEITHRRKVHILVNYAFVVYWLEGE